MPKERKRKESKEEKRERQLLENFVKVIQQYISGRQYVPMTFEDLIERLQINELHHKLFKKALKQLVDTDVIEVVQKRYSLLQHKNDIIRGTLSVHARGFAFLRPDDPKQSSQDIFIPKHLTKDAVDGDIVEVLVNWNSVPEKGPEGRVVTIIQRGRTHLAGTIRYREGSVCEAYVPLLGASQAVEIEASEGLQLEVGHRVILQVLEWGTKQDATRCLATHIIGHIDDPSSDIRCAIEEYGLRDDFPVEARHEAERYGTRIPLQEIKKRRDFREWECVTIDPDTAKDFDDAISLTITDKGYYQLGVHIADVTHYVTVGSELDKEATLRCNSTYFPGRCVPMLPSSLSDNLCSLKPDVNRLTVSVIMTLDQEGNLLNYQIDRGVIRSQRRFTYRSAKEVLDKKKKSVHLPLLERMVALCGKLKKKRYERGSIEFSLPEFYVQVDQEGVAHGVEKIEYDITHQLVEEFMLKANEVVATHLNKLGKAATYRIHEEPASDNINDFVNLAKGFGCKVPSNPSPMQLQQLFDEIADEPFAQFLATSFIRCMRLAFYSPESIGHYGLSLEHYCHFTSPIRRYADLIIHRILFHEDISSEQLEKIAERCSEQERISAKAENSVKLLKKLRLLGQWKSQNQHIFEAVITRVRHFGIFFEVCDLMLEGFVHISALGREYFHYEEQQMRLISYDSGRTFRCGDRITVALDNIHYTTMESEWSMVSTQEKRQPSKSTQKGRKPAKKGEKKARSTAKKSRKRSRK